MFSDIEDEERMKRTRSNRHKKYLSDFETDRTVEEDNYLEDEVKTVSANIAEENFQNEDIRTKIQNESEKEIEKPTRKRIYNSDYNSNDFITCSVKISKSRSNIVESVSIKKTIEHSIH